MPDLPNAQHSHTAQRRGAMYGLAAAALFGISTPLAKLLVPASSPVALASLLYLGAACALYLTAGVQRVRGTGSAESVLRVSDAPLLAIVAVCGGVLGPVLMLFGLARLPAVTASLLLNLEAPFTIGIAILILREHLGWRELGAASFIVIGAVLLGGTTHQVGGELLGAIAIAAACLCWAVDNNLTQRLSVRDPIAVVRVKTMTAGVGNGIVALVIGAHFPSDTTVLISALCLGALSYGCSTLLDAYALRLLGAAREAAYFANAPFFGATLAWLLLRETVGLPELVAAGLITIGVVLLLRERHEHEHRHETTVHDHLHVHDAHHQHGHSEAAVEPHSHVHAHDPVLHSHPHVSDLHHRHRH